MGAAALAFDNFDPCTCSECGIVYYVPDNYQRRRREDHKTFYCPNGHNQYYPGESEAERNARLLREERERHQRTLQRANEAEAERRKAESALKRHKTRSKNGVCPCCKRTFKQLAAHMKTKHPDYK